MRDPVSEHDCVVSSASRKWEDVMIQSPLLLDRYPEEFSNKGPRVQGMLWVG
ncbi:MAG: hypothetical protein ACON4H_08200 [Rubripirellula sp.]